MSDQTMDFGEALRVLKSGGRVAREGWNGKGMHLVLVSDWNGKINAEFAESFRLLPWIGMKTAQGDFVPWLASQTDIIAGDWMSIGSPSCAGRQRSVAAAESVPHPKDEVSATIGQLAEAFEAWENGFRAEPSRFMTAEECAASQVSELSASRAAYFMELLKADGETPSADVSFCEKDGAAAVQLPQEPTKFHQLGRR